MREGFERRAGDATLDLPLRGIPQRSCQTEMTKTETLRLPVRSRYPAGEISPQFRNTVSTTLKTQNSIGPQVKLVNLEVKIGREFMTCDIIERGSEMPDDFVMVKLFGLRILSEGKTRVSLNDTSLTASDWLKDVALLMHETMASKAPNISSKEYLLLRNLPLRESSQASGSR